VSRATLAAGQIRTGRRRFAYRFIETRADFVIARLNPWSRSRFALLRRARENLTLAIASRIIRHLHRAFKGLSTDEIYDVLMEQLLMAVKKYDPAITENVKITAEKIDEVMAHARRSHPTRWPISRQRDANPHRT
jgi:hypothetical protein